MSATAKDYICNVDMLHMLKKYILSNRDGKSYLNVTVAQLHSLYPCLPPFTSNSTFVEWKIGPPETVDTHSDSDIEASAEAFIADKVSQAWEMHHKR